MRALSEYVQHDPTVNPIGTSLCELLTAPLLVGPEALACTPDIPYPTMEDDWELCQVRVYSGKGSGQVRTETDGGQGQKAGQEISPAGVGDRLDSTTKDNER